MFALSINLERGPIQPAPLHPIRTCTRSGPRGERASIDRDRAPAFWSSMRTTTTATRCRFISNSKAPAISNPVEGVKVIVLGGRPDAVYMPGQLSLTPGDGIYVFTDGGTEANNATEEMFGETRLEAVLRGRGDCRSADIIKSVAEAVRGFVGTAVPFDDITMLALRRLQSGAL
jgi:hypothetical protein